ncbi:MAG: cyanophycinase [Planctomycetaceae bacterium]
MIRHFGCALLALWFLATTAWGGLPPDPLGLPGTVVVCGESAVALGCEAVRKTFPKGEQPVVLIVDAGHKETEIDRNLTSAFAEHSLVPQVIHYRNDFTADDWKAIQEQVAKVSGVWVLIDPAPLSQVRHNDLVDLLRSVQRRQGTVTLVGHSVNLAGHSNTSPATADTPAEAKPPLIPHVQFQVAPTTPVTQPAGSVRFEMGSSNGLLFRGREIKVIGTSEAAPVVVTLLPSQRRKELRTELKPGAVADLVALQRAALFRAGTPFPPEHRTDCGLKSGALLIAGGGAFSKEMIDLFVAKAGGEKARIVIIPTADESPQLEGRWDQKAFLKAGAGKVTILHSTNREEILTKAFQEPLVEATGIWFGGGRQWRLVDAYADTPIVDLCHQVLARGGIIAGSSAGATIQGDYLVRGHPLGNQVMMAEGYEQGFAFLPGTAIDQHFTQRKRQPDMEELKQTFPQLLGIGIDESTAILVEGNQAQVLGPGTTSFYDHFTPNTKPPTIIPSGKTYTFPKSD